MQSNEQKVQARMIVLLAHKMDVNQQREVLELISKLLTRNEMDSKSLLHMVRAQVQGRVRKAIGSKAFEAVE